MHSQLSVLMFADLVGYSAMMEADQQQALNVILDMRKKHFEPVVERHGGTVLKRLGDGWIVSFGSVVFGSGLLF